MPVKKNFVFYGNSSLSIGSGHIMRLIALAQYAQQAGFAITFVYKECLPLLQEKLQKEGFQTVQLSASFNHEFIMQLAPTHIAVDDYYLSAEEWLELEQLPSVKIVFDDALNQNPLYADLVINASPAALIAEYQQRAPKALLCLGPQFAIIRKEFATAFLNLPAYATRKKVLITMGGTDVKKIAKPLAEYLLTHYPELQLSLILGSADPQYTKELQTLADKKANLDLFINSNQVAQIMAESGLAISAAGGTLSELACLQIPTIALVCADNQQGALESRYNNTWYRGFDFRNDQDNQYQRLVHLANLVYELFNDYPQRLAMHHKASEVVDTQGCQRILNAMNIMV